MSLDNEVPCPGCGIAIGDHTIRGYQECLEIAGFDYELPAEDVPGGPISFTSFEGEMAGEVAVASLVIDTALGKLPALRFTFIGSGAAPMSRVSLPHIHLVMDAKGLRSVAKLVTESVERAISATQL